MRVGILKLSPDFLDGTVLTKVELVVCLHYVADGQHFATSDGGVCTEFRAVVVSSSRRSIDPTTVVGDTSRESASSSCSYKVILIDDDAVDVLGAISAGVRVGAGAEGVAAVHGGNAMREGDGDGVDGVPEVGVGLVRGGVDGILEAVAELVEGSEIESEVSAKLVMGERGDGNAASSSSSRCESRSGCASNKFPTGGFFCQSPCTLRQAVSGRFIVG